MNKNYKEIILKTKGRKEFIEKQISKTQTELSTYSHKLELIEKAQIFLQEVARKTQENLKYQIEDVVNLALETCFPGEYKFEIRFEIMRGKTEADLFFTSQKTGKRIDPMNASGGGVVDLVAFALRVSFYALERNTDNVIILDEPFKFISRDLVASACEIMKRLSDKMKVQFIIVTHLPEIVEIADRVFTVKKGKDGVSRIKVS